MRMMGVMLLYMGLTVFWIFWEQTKEDPNGLGPPPFMVLLNVAAMLFGFLLLTLGSGLVPH